MLRAALLTVAVLSAGSAVGAGVPEAMDPAEIPAYRVLCPGLVAAGQPSPATLERLGALGFRTVVNIRTAAEGAEAEGEVMRAAGLRYVWVPVTAATFSLADVEAIEEVLEDPGSGPVLLHCASSNRVGAVWAVIQARLGRSVEEAETEGEHAGLVSPTMREAVRRVLGAAPPKASPSIVHRPPVRSSTPPPILPHVGGRDTCGLRSLSLPGAGSTGTARPIVHSSTPPPILPHVGGRDTCGLRSLSLPGTGSTGTARPIVHSSTPPPILPHVGGRDTCGLRSVSLP